MKLYTKTGDGGFASLPGAAGRVRKDDPRFSAIGGLDELNAAVGFCLVEAGRAGDASVADALGPVQAELFSVGAILATVGCRGRGVCGHADAQALTWSQTPRPRHPDDDAVARMEKRIDTICDELPELKDFILPGGCELVCRLHLARTIARRAERAVVAALNPTDDGQCSAPDALRYINRLSDLLFVLARLANHNAGEEEVAPKSKS